MKKILAILLALAMVFSFAACGKEKADEQTEYDPSAKSEGVMTYDEYMAAEMDSDVVFEGFITAKNYAAEWGNITFFVQDPDGAYFVYRMPATDADDKVLGIGQKVQIKGPKTEWAGEVEIKEGAAECTVITGESYTFEAEDVTSLFGSDDLIKKQNMLVAVKGLEVVDTPLYNWDGSGASGDDLYLTAKVNGAEYDFVVETDFADSDVYKTVEGLTAGQTVDVTGLMYWYEGPQMWITGIELK